jgi:UDP-glucose 4-epimerase
MSNYLVTGAAGFIGSALARALMLEGHFVVTIDNLSTGYEENIPEKVVFIEGDCADEHVYAKIPQVKYDAIIHIAGQSSGEISFDDPVYDIRTNAESTLLLLKFALSNGCHRFVYASTMSVYGIKPDRPVKENEDCLPQSFYGVGKIASEHYLRIYKQYGINSTSLRLFNVYGPGQNLSNLRQGMVSIFLAQMLANGAIHVKGSPERFRDFIYIDDVVRAFVSCLSCNGSWNTCINVGTGVRSTVKDVVDFLSHFYGSNVIVKYEGATAGDIHGLYSDISQFNEVFGDWEMVGLKDGIGRMVEFYHN